MTDPTKINNFEGWAILETFGRNRYAGYVTTQVFGSTSFFHLQVPAVDENEHVTDAPSYVGGHYAPAGTRVRHGALQSYAKLLAIGGIAAITPCTKEVALATLRELQPPPVIQITLPNGATKQPIERKSEPTT